MCQDNDTASYALTVHIYPEMLHFSSSYQSITLTSTPTNIKVAHTAAHH